jgi:hypothetical protein
MIPDAQDILKNYPNSREWFGREASPRTQVTVEVMREYGRRLLDHVCNQTYFDGVNHVVKTTEIVKIKDEL